MLLKRPIRNPLTSSLPTRCLPWLPALITLLLIAVHRVNVPYFDSWWFVEAYRSWQNGAYGVCELFATHGPHPSVPGKLIYWFAMHVTKGDVGWLPFAAWTFTLGAALAVAAMIKRTFAETRTRGWLLFFANSLLFTTAAGSTWLWDFCFQNYIVGMCLALALWSLSRAATGRAVAGAWFFASLGALSFGSGFTIAWLLLPLVWLHASSGRLPHARWWLSGSVILALALTWLGMVFLPSLGAVHEQARAAERAESLLTRPLMTAKYLLVVLGGSLGHGTPVDPEILCLLAGAGAAAVFAACLWQLWRLRDDLPLLASAWPWLACCGFALLNTLMIALARMGKGYTTALAPRYVVFTLFFMLGVVMLSALLLPRRRAMAAAAVLLALQVVNWLDGANAMRHFHHVLAQNRAALSLARVLPLFPDRVIQHGGPDSVKTAAIFLHDQGRLRGVKMIDDTRIATLRDAGPLTAKSARIDTAGRTAGGKIVLQGVCEGGKNIGEIPDLILITAQEPAGEERIIAFQFPTMPADYFNDSDRRHQEERHYEGWRVVLDQAPVPGAPGTLLRAYAMGGEAWRIRRIPGEFPVPGK